MKREVKSVCNQAQRLHLLECLKNAAIQHRNRIDAIKFPETREVKQALTISRSANRIIERHYKVNRRKRHRMLDRMRLMQSKVNEKILFGNPEAALKAVKSFEKKIF